MNEGLKFTEFEIHMIYGFLVSPGNEGGKIGDQIEEYIDQCVKDKKNWIRNGWCSSYQIDSNSNQYIQLPIFETNSSKKESSIDIEVRKDDSEKVKWKSARSSLNGKLSEYFTIRGDGVGALTLSFKFDKLDNESYYNISDILRVLLLAPRTSHNEEGERIKVVGENELLCPPQMEIKENSWNSLSYPFKIFIKRMVEKIPFGLNWSEVALKDYPKKNTIYDGFKQKVDPQIPYFFVFGKMPYEQYKTSFLFEDEVSQENRKKYSNQIASLLGRWLNEHNIPFASVDYWRQKSAVEGACFQSKYMNNLLFTTFSGHVTLSLYPAIECSDGEQSNIPLMANPIKITRESVLRCLELSRMRWHHAISLNRELDNLIKKCADLKSTNDFIPILRAQAELEEKVALHLENPISYLWNASVGNHIAEFLHCNIIDKIENEITSKLERVHTLLDVKLKIFETEDFVSKVLN